MGDIEGIQIILLILFDTVGAIILFFSGIMFLYNRNIQPIAARSRLLIWSLFIVQIGHFIWYPIR